MNNIKNCKKYAILNLAIVTKVTTSNCGLQN